MIEYKSNYVLYARSAGEESEGPSGNPDMGYEITGNYVNWSSSTGVTGQGWSYLISAPNSPFAGMDVSGIEAEIAANSNLNKYFLELATLPASQTAAFIRYLQDNYGYTDQGGCIGDRLYN